MENKNFKQKPIFVKEKTWMSFKKVANFYGTKIPFALDDALNEYIKNKMKDIEKSESK